MAFLWVPPRTPQVRGVVMAGMTLMEREFAKDPIIRRACAGAGLAIAFLKCGLGSVDVQAVLDALAKASGYRELSLAPLFFVGHSAGGPQAKACALKFAERCFGLVQYRGGAPGGQPALPPGVPALMMVGQFDEFGGVMRDEKGRETWEGARDALAGYRAKEPRNLASIVVEPGAGHFAWSERNARYLALFIRKAAQARIPDWPVEAAKPAKCKDVDHTTGWLTDLTIKKPGPRPAPFADYRGDKKWTSWHFDRESAMATEVYHEGVAGKKDQFIRWDDPYWVDAGARFFFTRVTWVDDGQTFEVHPAYATTYPKQHGGRGPKWPQAGQSIGHSSSPIKIKVVGGPLAVVGDRKLRIQFDNLAPATERSRATFMAHSARDEQYRYTEQVGMLPRGFRGFTRGKDQTITFPQPPNLKVGGPPVELKATSSAGLPVEYYVAFGPAVVEGQKLKVSELPVRARSPIPVKVVAYQFGRGFGPLVKTATPVERTVLIEKP